MLDDYSFLLPVIVGGLLTIIAGIASNAVLSSRSMKYEKHLTSRDKLEEIYEMTQSVINLLYTTSLNDYCPTPKITREDYKIDRIGMLINLYHPWLRNEYNLFSKNFWSYHADMEYYYSLVTGEDFIGTKISAEEKRNMTDIQYKIVRDANRELESSAYDLLIQVEDGFQHFM